MSKPTFFLVEIAAGYIVLRIKEWESIAQSFQETQQALLNFEKFKQVISVERFQLFNDAKIALEACQTLALGKCPESLLECLRYHFSKNNDYQLGVIDPTLGKDLCKIGFKVFYDKSLIELARICHVHMDHILSAHMEKSYKYNNLYNFQVGLGHNFSRSKLKLDPNRQDKPIQNSIALIENFDKSLNQFSMRVKEWYSWHFPELGKILTDNYMFAQAVCLIRIKEHFNRSELSKLIEIVKDEAVAEEIMTAKDVSMGQDILEMDMKNIEIFAKEFIKIYDQRKELLSYLSKKLDTVAPNLKVILGEVLAAKLIAHAGSLTNLAKYPASTIQILGAEKALFRALKTKGNTPKYGLLFQSSYIGRAALKNKGRISRYLANKCSLAARIDSFANIPNDIYGQKLKEQIEARLNYLSDGIATKKNLEVMKEAAEEYAKLVESYTKKQKIKEIIAKEDPEPEIVLEKKVKKEKKRDSEKTEKKDKLNKIKKSKHKSKDKAEKARIKLEKKIAKSKV